MNKNKALEMLASYLEHLKEWNTSNDVEESEQNKQLEEAVRYAIHFIQDPDSFKKMEKLKNFEMGNLNPALDPKPFKFQNKEKAERAIDRIRKHVEERKVLSISEEVELGAETQQEQLDLLNKAVESGNVYIDHSPLGPSNIYKHIHSEDTIIRLSNFLNDGQGMTVQEFLRDFALLDEEEQRRVLFNANDEGKGFIA